MAGEIASAYLTIYPKLEGKSVVDEIGKTMGSAGKSAGRTFAAGASAELTSGMGKAGGAGSNALVEGFSAAKVAIGNVIADIAESAASEFSRRFGDGIEQSDALQKFTSTMKFAGFDTKQIEAVRDAMKSYADSTVYDLGEVMDTTAKLAANGVRDFDSLVQASGNLNAAAGGNSESFGYFANAITQVNGAGKLMAQDWNQIVNALPGASGAIQNELKQMGAWDDSMGSFKDAMAAGEISADEFNAAIQNLGMTDVAQEAATSTTTFEGAMGQLDASVTNTMQGIYDSLNQDGRITDAINGIGEAFESASPFISQLAQAFGDFVQLISPALPIIAGVVAGFAGFSIIATIVGAVTSFVTVMGTAIAAVSGVPAIIGAIVTVLGGPIPVIGAIIGAIVAFIATNEDMRNKVVEIFENVKKTVTTVLDNVKAAWESAKQAISTTVDNIKSAISTGFTAAKQAITGAIDAIKGAVSAGFNAVRTTITTVMNFVRSIISTVTNAMKTTWQNALNMMKNALSTAVNGIRSVLGTLQGIVTGALRNAGTWLVSAGRNIIKGLANGIRGAIGWVTSAVSSVCSNAIGYLKGFFGISSPSKLMAEMGEYMMAGLADGIDDGTSKATGAMSDASSEIAGALGMDLNGTMRYGSTVSKSAPSQAGGVVVTGNTFVVRKDSDIQAIGRAINQDAERRRRARL